MPDSIEHPDRLVIYPSRLKATLVLLGAIAFVALGIWIASPGMARRVGPWEVFFGSYVGVPFFAACALSAAHRIVFRRPVVEMDATGITDSSNFFGVGHLNWDEVDRAVLYRYHRQPMLGIFPKDLDAFLGRLSAARRSYARINLALGIPPVNISQVVLPMTVAELAGLMQTRYGVRVVGTA